MAENSKIEWCDHTFNPWIGCAKVSAGCANCYAESMMDKRLNVVNWGRGNPRKRTSAANWKMPLKWNNAENYKKVSHQEFYENVKPRVFCGSLCDWLDDEVPIECLADLLDLIRQTPNLYWLLLTKRPELWRERVESVAGYAGKMGEENLESNNLWAFAFDWLNGSSPSNVWIGTSVENQEAADNRILKLLKIPAMVRFLSCEPLLGAVDLLSFWNKESGTNSRGFPAWRYKGCIDWVICGGESGPNARPMHPDWARSLRDQCASAGVPFFFKQWGEWAQGSCVGAPDAAVMNDGRVLHDWTAVAMRDADREAPVAVCCPEIMARVGKKVAGRLLDGVKHDQFPDLRGGAE